ncbi:methyltransferaseS [Acrasis kona]|uniref:MethyltransferaseS n=1 Tax=Acrasis kona TaxID=1008807 RepID=A0AAW2ZCC8_9EUKA
MTILDVGCGPGTITIDLAELVPHGHVIGIDTSEETLQLARNAAVERGVKNVEFVLGDGNSLNYSNGSFDVVHAHQVLQHVNNPVRLLSEMKRVTRKGGVVAVRETDFDSMTAHY